MSRQQTTVIWLGLLLVTFNIIIHIGEIKSVIFGTSSSTTTTVPTKNTPAGNPVLPAQPSPAPNVTPTNVVAT